jgi:hypothetical protein
VAVVSGSRSDVAVTPAEVQVAVTGTCQAVLAFVPATALVVGP